MNTPFYSDCVIFSAHAVVQSRAVFFPTHALFFSLLHVTTQVGRECDGVTVQRFAHHCAFELNTLQWPNWVLEPRSLLVYNTFPQRELDERKCVSGAAPLMARLFCQDDLDRNQDVSGVKVSVEAINLW